MVYKTSNGQVFHLNSKSQIRHKLILQVISHQIKDNGHNHHGSIGLFKVGLVGNFGFGYFGLRHKDLASNLNGRSFPIPSCLDLVTIIFLLFYFLQQLHTWFRYLFNPKNLLFPSILLFALSNFWLIFPFSFSSFFLFFFLFPPFLMNI